MGILVDENTRLMVQGITGREGSFHALRCREYGANLVAGVTPGRGGQIFDGDVPVFNTVRQAVEQTQANCALIFVPPPFAADAIVESVDAGIPTIACITEGIPIMDTIAVKRYIRDKHVTLIGPNCPGMITPGANVKVGIMPGNIHAPGRIGVVSRSGTLTYEGRKPAHRARHRPVISCVGIGGDPVNGSSFVDMLKMFNDDDETDGVVMIGEIGGTREQEAAEYISSDFKKPMAAFIAGRSAPPGKRMGHAGAVITGRAARAEEKEKALAAAGVAIVPGPGEIGSTFQQVINA